jgi:hypothetical protein
MTRGSRVKGMVAALILAMRLVDGAAEAPHVGGYGSSADGMETARTSPFPGASAGSPIHRARASGVGRSGDEAHAPNDLE